MIPDHTTASAVSAASCLEVAWAGRTIVLHPEGAVVEPATATAYVADTHFGKPASFRRLGVPVPDGAAEADTTRLSTLIERSGVRRLVVLGDFLHDAHARSPETLAALAAWRGRHPSLEVTLVRGNHDLKAGDPPASLDIRTVPEPWDDGGITCRHHPVAAVAASPGPVEPAVLAGHLHPVVVMRGRGRAGGRQRCRCFHVSSGGLTLPAFGSFTGGAVVRPRSGERVFAVGPDVVVEVPLV